MHPIVIADYDPQWPSLFLQLRAPIWEAAKEFVVSVEHVGSTSVPGLCAKPVIDMSAVVSSSKDLSLAIDRLSALGYLHRGNLGIQDREAFRSPGGSVSHHLYVCLESGLGIRNQLAVRDFLRGNTQKAVAYGNLKRKLAKEFPFNMVDYVEGKTKFLLDVLRESGFSAEDLAEIESSNRK